jgi:AGCS family alanine or glycine:cation symporter
MTASLTDTLNAISGLVWGWPLMLLLIGTGTWFTFLLRGLQFRLLPHALWLAFVKRREAGSAGDISHFQALMTAMAATVGTGNIVGVATAIAIGGPGAVFWLWLTGLVGMVTKYAEALLAVKFRVVTANGTMAGGPMYYIERGLHQKWLAVLFAGLTVLASFGIGNMTQANAVASGLQATFGVNPRDTGAVLTLLSGLVLLFGIKGIARVTSVLVPFMIVFYLAITFGVLIANAQAIPSVIGLILQHAFTPTAAAGGFAGAALAQTIRVGLARGLFSNESGLGSAPIAAAAARTNHPVVQALVSMTQTFIDTLLICSMTALVILSSGAWTQTGPDGNGLTGALLSATAFSSTYGRWAGQFATVALVLFAWSTLIGWGYYGEKALEYLIGAKAIPVYRAVFVSVVYLGCVTKLETCWTLSDIFNGLMALPNLVALLCLSPLVAAETRAYLADRVRKQHVREGGGIRPGG